MKLKVGMALHWRGETWVCTRIDRYEGFYKECSSSAEWCRSLHGMVNVIIAGPYNIEHFEVGDVVHRREIRAVLEVVTPGPATHKFFHVYTYLTIKLLVKGEGDGATGSTGRAAAQAQPAEATREQLGSWESAWLEGVGEASDAVDRVGPVQQDVDNPAAPEEGVYAAADDGDSDPNRSSDAV